MKKIIFVILTMLVFMTGCSSFNTVIKKRNLATETKMSETVWLNPELIGNKTIFVQIKNTSTKPVNIDSQIRNILTSKGYKIVTTPKNANYWLQVNVLKLDKVDLKDSNPAQSGLAGAGIGAMAGLYNTGSVNTGLGLGLVGGAIGVAADALIEDTKYTMITDILVAEKTDVIVNTQNVNMVKQGTRGVAAVTSNRNSNMNKYQTRIVSVANQVNLKFEEAAPMLEQELMRSISNIF
ncbi:MAG: complement resistance protein TraT [Cetobacterium sp.]|uniref:TraT complement resistance protein n=1 Tax=Cetobacterium ceti TaxID=180163 RepID=A0A1T4PGT1_9FUSO|nr:complement resistance protein TraT [Cetobacterium ceti]MCJ8343049.1 complement resistance protein TraT [Cetobacterium sp.]SJZ90537.1 TraT complement resistance protein [Cetobacterium ceti]